MAELISEETTPTLDEALGWLGFRVDDISGGTVGRLEEIYVDATDGTPQWLLIKLSRFGRQAIAPFGDAAAGAGHVWIPYQREVIRAAEISGDEPLTQAEEISYCNHYGIIDGAGRRAQVAEREQSEVTSVPNSKR